MMPEHVCSCYQCKPRNLPPVPDEDAPYIGISDQHRRPLPVWAARRDWQPPGCQRKVFVNGEEVSNVTRCVTEAHEGVVGWIVTEHGELGEYCPCGSEFYCQQVEWGYVEIDPPIRQRLP